MKMLRTIIALFMLSLLCGCNDLLFEVGKHVDIEKSKYYRYGRRDKSKVFYFVNKAIGDTPKEVKGADIETFSVVSTYWGKDKNAVYYQGTNRITDVDLASFSVIEPSPDNEGGQEVIRDKFNVYYVSYPDSKAALSVVEHANPETFQDLGRHETNIWSVDKNSVFLNYKIFPADRVSFMMINDRFFKDKNHLFMNSYKISVSEEVNTDELELLNSFHIRTNSHIYFFNGSPAVPVAFPVSDITSVEVFFYSPTLIKADNRLYIKGHLLNNDTINIKNFRHAGGKSRYFNDGKNIYFYGWNSDQIIWVSSDAASFIEMGHYGKDSKHAYFHQNVIKDADPATFYYDEVTDKIYDSKGEFINDVGLNEYVRRKKK